MTEIVHSIIRDALIDCGIPDLDRIITRLVDEFNKLGIKEDWNLGENQFLLGAMSLQHKIEFIIRDLILYGIVWAPVLEEMGRKGNPKQELENVIQSALSLISALRELKLSALIALGGGEIEAYGGNSLSEKWEAELAQLAEEAKAALAKVSPTKGRPKLQVPQLIAFNLAGYYPFLKGVPPNARTGRGSFYHFLSRIYAVLDIHVDVMAQLKLALPRSQNPENNL